MKSIEDADVRELAGMESGERAFVSCYLSPPDQREWLERRASTLQNILQSEGETEDLEHFRQGLRLVGEWLDEHHTDQPAVCVFACFALDFVRGFALPVETPTLLRLGPGPLIRPLVEIEDEHEDFVFVSADNSAAQIHFVSTAVIRSREKVKGGVKNRVKKGGWSQKRYQRRRENQLQHYAKEISEQLEGLYKKRRFGRLVLLGSQETRQAILDELSPPVAETVVGSGPAQLSDDEQELLDAAQEFVEKAERKDEQSLWQQIKAELASGGLAATGPEDVWQAAANGRADIFLVNRELKLGGVKCRQCENVGVSNDSPRCGYCGSDDTFGIDAIDELVRQAERTSASVDFVDPFPALAKVGGVACLLRY